MPGYYAFEAIHLGLAMVPGSDLKASNNKAQRREAAIGSPILNRLADAMKPRSGGSNPYAGGIEGFRPFWPGLEDVLEDSDVSEITINRPHSVWIERGGRLQSHDESRFDGAALQRAAIHIARPGQLDFLQLSQRLAMEVLDHQLPSPLLPKAAVHPPRRASSQKEEKRGLQGRTS